MPYGYNNRNSYRGSTGYRPSDRRREKKKKINFRRIRNRAIIIGAGLLILALIFFMLTKFFSCVCGSSNGNGSTLDTSTVRTKETTAPSEDNKTWNFKTANIRDTDKKSKGVSEAGMYVWNQACFEPFYGEADKAKEYAEVMNYAKKTLGKDTNVYSAIIPNHTEMGLPDRLKNTDGGITTNSQADYIKTAYEAMDSSVTPINVYDKLAEHCNEYIYFNSDHHWTGLGGYYGYTAFTDASKQTALNLEDCTKNTIKGFTGSFTQLVTQPLKTDNVHFWSMPFDLTNKWTDANGTVNTAETLYYWYATAGTNTYGVFLFGDNPIEIIKSKSPNAKGKIAIIHESYGNAFVPYFTNNYEEVYSIDFRSWDGKLKDFCKKNKIDNVLFANGVMSSATEDSLKAIKSTIG